MNPVYFMDELNFKNIHSLFQLERYQAANMGQTSRQCALTNGNVELIEFIEHLFEFARKSRKFLLFKNRGELTLWIGDVIDSICVFVRPAAPPPVKSHVAVRILHLACRRHWIISLLRVGDCSMSKHCRCCC